MKQFIIKPRLRDVFIDKYIIHYYMKNKHVIDKTVITSRSLKGEQIDQVARQYNIKTDSCKLTYVGLQNVKRMVNNPSLLIVLKS